MFDVNRRTAILAFAALLAVPSASATAQTIPTAAFFNETVVQDVQLLVNTRDLRMLRERYQENVFFAADMVWQGTRVRNVAIRSRGTGSRNAVKLGLQVDFGRYTSGQTFLGMESLVLDNLWQDPSLIREVLAMSMFRRMGQAAPRESFCRLFINGEYQGLYALVETITPAFAAAQTNSTDGFLYEYRYQTPFYTEYLGDTLAPYKKIFEPRSHQLDAESTLYAPVRDLFFEVNQPDDAVWRERVDARIDLTQFMTYVAIEGFIAQNDGILGYAGINNFYLHRPLGSTRHRIFPWDQDFGFSFVGASILRRGGQPVILFERAFADPELRELFLKVIEQCVEQATTDGWLAAEIERISTLITPAVVTDTKKQFSTAAFLDEIDFLRAFTSERPAIVLAEVAGIRGVQPDSPTPMNPPTQTP